MKQVKVSVVMATYNGEKYIQQQLDSILFQTRKPDEILIFDDVSTDRTREILACYEEKYDNIKITINNKNLGWKQNFAKGINKATGDIIFLADQDDIWFKDKVDKMTNAIMENSSIELLASNFIPLYASDNAIKLANYQLKKYGKSYLAPVRKSNWLCEQLRPGCCYCFKRNLIDYFNRIWETDDAHDAVLYIIAAFRESLYIINDNLIYFRRHDKNNSPISQHNVEGRVNGVNGTLKLISTIEQVKELNLSNNSIRILHRYQYYLKARRELISRKTLCNIVTALRYIDYYPRFKAFLGDIIFGKSN